MLQEEDEKNFSCNATPPPSDQKSLSGVRQRNAGKGLPPERALTGTG
jgi:hypothetical protein